MKPIQKIVENVTQWYQAKIFPVLIFLSLACGCNVNRDYFRQMKELGFIMKEESIRKCKIQPYPVA